MSNLVTRILFAVFAIPSVLFALWWGDFARWIVLALICGVGAWEYSRMLAKRTDSQSTTWFSPIIVVVLLFSQHPILKSGLVTDLLLGISLLLTILIAFNRVELAKIWPWISGNFFGIWFFGIYAAGAHSLWSIGQGFEKVYPFLFVLISMWVVDTGAYFSGRTLGKRKLCPEISPKKTWEGAVGGGLLMFGWGLLMGPKMLSGIHGFELVLLIVLITVSAMVGDLFMSTLKRYAGFKDSSGIFPGHGGMLDRMDSFLLSAPLVAYWLIARKDLL